MAPPTAALRRRLEFALKSKHRHEFTRGTGGDSVWRRNDPHPPFGHPLPGGEGLRRAGPYPAS
jgi:hypothetical protein